MRSNLVLSAMFCLLCSLAGLGQDRPPLPTPPADWVTPDIPGVVAGGTKIELVKYGLQASEAPIAMPDGSVAMIGGGLIKIDKNGNLSVLVENVDGALGLGVDSKGRMIAVQSVGKVSVLYPKDKAAVLVDNYEGKPFIRPNDMVMDNKDGVYFTDSYPLSGPPNPLPPLPQAVYYIPSGGKPVRVAQDVTRPNGITLSLDGKILYVNDWGGDYLVAYDVQPDGTLKNRRNFAKYEDVRHTDKGFFKVISGADGLTIDNDGRTYAHLSKDFTTPVGIQVFGTNGQHLGTIPIPIQGMGGNLGFAGSDKKDLYVVGRGAVFKIHMLAEGPKNRAR